MSNLDQLYTVHGQSPWLDDLRREWLRNGHLQNWIERGVRGVTSNPSTFQKAVAHSSEYDEELAALAANGASSRGILWTLAVNDVERALDLFLPVHVASDGEDGFVSLELSPELAHDSSASVVEARRLHVAIGAPNLYVKIPGTTQGVTAIRQLFSEGHNINVTLLFSVQRYADVIEAYLSGLEAHEGDLSRIHSVASFFVSRIDAEVDRRLEKLGSPEALALRGQAAIAQAKLAYGLFSERFSGPRWNALRERGAQVQRPLWASMSTKNPTYADTKYAEALIAPKTVSTMPEPTLNALEDHGRLDNSLDRYEGDARGVLERLKAVGVDVEEVARTLEADGIEKFSHSFGESLKTIEARASASRSGVQPV